MPRSDRERIIEEAHALWDHPMTPAADPEARRGDPMTTPDGLTAESEAVVAFYEREDGLTPHQKSLLVELLLAAEAAAVARHVRETGCDGLREALTKHRLMLPPHPHGFYIHSALCSCDTWQWDGPGPDLSPVAEQVWADWGDHLLAALAPTVAACAREGCGHRDAEHDYPDQNIACCGDGCSCPGYLAPSSATEAERRGGE